MVKHIVMWKLNESLSDSEKVEAKNNMKQKLEALVGKVPGLISLQVGFNYKEAKFDLCLVGEYESKEALEGYQQHPEHLKVKAYVHSVVCDRAFCDFEY